MKSKPLVFFCLVILAVPTLSYAADFLPLVGIPGVTNAGNAGFGAYINALYRLSISIAALLAVIKIVAAGAKYMLSDIVTSKESAKDDIRGALIGLLIIIGAVVILTTINSDITENNFVIAPLQGVDGSDTSFPPLATQGGVCTRAETLGSTCMILRCERGSVGGINNFEMNPGETEEQACLRTCRDTYNGYYTYNPVSSSLCTFVDTEANTCDRNSNWNCCEERNNGSWDADARTCTLEPGTTVDDITERGCESRPGFVWTETQIPRAGGATQTTCIYAP